MKQELEKLISDKKKKLTQLDDVRNNILATVYECAIKNKTLEELHKQVNNILNKNKIKIADKEMVRYTLQVYPKIKKSSKLMLFLKPENVPIEIYASEVVYKQMKKYKVFSNFKSLEYENVKRYEAKEKENIISKSVKENRKNYVIFYLASEHEDCADDHKAYQGKLYVDSNWESIVKDLPDRKEIKSFIASKDIKTFQRVINSPAWIITRPNCRHYFKEIASEEAMSESVNALIKKYNMHSKIGLKRMQPIYHSTKREWYVRENVKTIIGKYEERLSFHKKLSSVYKNETLTYDIRKDKLLIAKWKEYLQNIKK